MLQNRITSKIRLKILVKVFTNAAINSYLRGLANEMQESNNVILKKLNNFKVAYYLKKEVFQNQISYKANTKFPLYRKHNNIIFQQIGLDFLVIFFFVIGNFINVINSGTTDRLVNGHKFTEYIKNLSFKIEKEIKRMVQLFIIEKFDENGLMIFEVETNIKNEFV